MIALLSGEVSVGFLPTSPALPHIKAGKLRALAVTKAQRLSIAPDLPTVAEAGLPGYEASSFYGLLVPAKTPTEIIARLHAESARLEFHVVDKNHQTGQKPESQKRKQTHHLKDLNR